MSYILYNCPSLTALHVNCTPELLYQSDVPGDYQRDSSEWLRNHNYANECLVNEPSKMLFQETKNMTKQDIIIYNTKLWNYLKTLRSDEYYYYTGYDFPGGHGWNYVKTIARSLEDTPLSFELVSSRNDSGRICWRFYAAVFKDNALSGYKKFSFKHTGDATLNAEHSGYVKDFVKPSATVYAGKDQPKTSGHAQRIKYKTVPTLEWFAFGDKFHHGKDDSNAYITIWCQYKTSGDSTTFWELNPDHQGSILSFKAEQASYGFLTGDTTNGILPFLNLRLKNNIKIRVMGNIMSLAGWRDYLRPY